VRLPGAQIPSILLSFFEMRSKKTNVAGIRSELQRKLRDWIHSFRILCSSLHHFTRKKWYEGKEWDASLRSRGVIHSRSSAKVPGQKRVHYYNNIFRSQTLTSGSRTATAIMIRGTLYTALKSILIPDKSRSESSTLWQSCTDRRLLRVCFITQVLMPASF